MLFCDSTKHAVLNQQVIERKEKLRASTFVCFKSMAMALQANKLPCS